MFDITKAFYAIKFESEELEGMTRMRSKDSITGEIHEMDADNEYKTEIESIISEMIEASIFYEFKNQSYAFTTDDDTDTVAMDYNEEYDPDSSIRFDACEEMGAGAFDYGAHFTSDGTFDEPASEGT